MEIFGFEVNSQTSDITKADKPGTQSLKIVPDSKQSDSWTILNINDTPLCTYSSGILTITSKGSDFLKSRKNTIPQQTILKPNSKTNKKYLYSKQESNQILKIKDPKSWLGSTIKVQGGSLQQDGSLSLTGGFGSVFVNDQFAVKHVKPQEDQQNLLEKEIEKAGYVNGLPNVIQTIAVESIEKNGNNGTLILMELATGMELSNWVQENQYRPIETILDIAKKVSTGMNAIHEIGVIHNDIKLENIIFDRKTGKLKIFDFGLSKFDGELCEPKGTRNYLSPEVLKVCYNQGMSKQTTASDVYGFGYLLLELFGQDNLGYSPFINNYKTNYFNNYNANYRMRNDINIDSKFLESQGVSPKNSQKFAEIISNCMKVNPEERWTMQQVLNALNEITL